MEFCTRVSNQLMLNMIEQGTDKNIVTSPLSLNVVLNMVASGVKGGALDHMLRMLGSENVDDINFESSKMMALVTGAEEEDGQEVHGDLNQPNQHLFLPAGCLDPSQTGNSGWPFPQTGNSEWPYQPIFLLGPKGKKPLFLPPGRLDPSQTGNSGWPFPQTGNWDRPYQPPSPVMPVAEGGLTSNKAKNGPTVAMVNGIWVDERFPLRSSYQDLVRGIYKCEAKTVDIFHKAREVESEINSWADAASRGLIKHILRPRSLHENTSIVLGNGLYFKGLWDNEYKFDARRTEERIFYLSNGDTVLVPFMTSHEEYYFGSFDGFKVLRIPYQGGNIHKKLSMYFFLPNEKDGLKNLVGKFSKNSRFLHQNLHLRKVPLAKFWIPKFKFTFEYDVEKVMNDAGAPLTFLQNPKDWADMMHIPESVPLMIPTVIQKAYVEIDEKGTEAAAITLCKVMMSSGLMPPPKVESFVADHPFMFMIKEETSISGLVLFTGAVLNPKFS